MKKTSIIVAIVNIALVLYLALVKYHFPNIAIVIMISLILGQIWYFLTSCVMTEYSLYKNNKIKLNIIGVIFMIIHIILFVYIFNIATASKAQSPLAWIYMAYIDFPLAPWFHTLLPLFSSLRITAIIVYGIFGTLFWYCVPHCIYQSFMRYKNK